MSHSTVLSFSVPRNKQSCYWRSGANLNTAKFQRFILLASFYSSSTNHNEVTTKTKKFECIYEQPLSSPEVMKSHNILLPIQRCKMPWEFCSTGYYMQVKLTFFTFLLWIILYETMFRHSYLSHWDSQEWYFIEVNSFAIRKENILDPPFDS